METQEMYLVLIGIIALLAGFSYSYITPTPVGLEGVPFSVMAAGLLLGGAVFFGYLGFIPALLFGMQTGADKNAAIFLYLLPCIIAIYAGTKLGVALRGDYKNNSVFLEQGKTILMLAITALVLAIAVETALPYLIAYWPKDFLGMSINQGSTIVGLIGKLGSLAMH